MNNQDDQLHRLLHKWREIDVIGNFDANVWCRIRHSEPTRTPTLAELWRRWVTQPAVSVAAAAVLAVVAGSAAGVLSARRPAGGADKELGFLSAGSLSGGYVRLATGADQ